MRSRNLANTAPRRPVRMGAGHLGEQQGRVMLEQLAGPQVHDAVAAVEQVRVRVEPVGRDRYLRLGGGQRQRALDAELDSARLAARIMSGVGLARGSGLCGPRGRSLSCTGGHGRQRRVPSWPRSRRASGSTARRTGAARRACRPGAARSRVRSAARRGVPPAADLDHGGERAAPVRLSLIGRMRPIPGGSARHGCRAAQARDSVIASRASGRWRAPAAAVPGPAELAAAAGSPRRGSAAPRRRTSCMASPPRMVRRRQRRRRAGPRRPCCARWWPSHPRALLPGRVT